MRVAAVDRLSVRAGLVPGMTLADARARIPGLHAAPHDPVADAAWLKALGDGAMRYTPLLARDPPDGLILDITGAAHPYGGEAGLVRDALTRLARWHTHVRWATAGHAVAARALARWGSVSTLAHWDGDPEAAECQAVRLLPVAALGLDGDSARALRRAGLGTIGDVAARPMASVAARFGANAVLALRQLLGEVDGPVRPHRRMPPIWLLKRLAEPLVRHADAMRIVERLAAGAMQQLADRGEGGRRFAAHFFRTDGSAVLLAVETGQPVRDVAVLMRLFAERMAALDDPLDPGFGYDAVALHVPKTEALAPLQPGLDQGESDGAALDALIDRLGVRLGAARVQRLVPADSHVPEQAELALPAAQAPAIQWKAAGSGQDPPLRPICLLDPPQPIMVLAEVPDGPPRRFRWRGVTHMVRLAEGPERIAAEWWRKDKGHVPGGGLPTRDYYRVEDVTGRRFWLFRHGLYQERAEPRWFVHGLFA